MSDRLSREPSVHGFDAQRDPVHRYATTESESKWVTVPGFDYARHCVSGHQLASEALPFMFPEEMAKWRFVRYAPSSLELTPFEHGHLRAAGESEAKVLPAFMYT